MLKHRRTLILAPAAVALALALAALLPGPAVLSVTFLDVGDGLCVVARSPSGRTLVIDCGTSSWRKPEAVGEKLAAPYLQSLGVDRIDVAILTHPHSDHMSGLDGLLKRKPADMVLDTGSRSSACGYIGFLRTARKSHAAYRVAQRGQVLDLDDGVSIQVLNPEPGEQRTDPNEDCIVLRIIYGRTAILIAADAGEEVEQSILRSGAPVRSQVLLVGHHGSARSSGPGWLGAVRPQVAVISCARNSEYGFPSREVLQRLRSLRSKVHVTGSDGAYTVTTDGSTISAHAFATPR